MIKSTGIIKATGIAIASLLVLSTSTFAASTPRIDAREGRQAHRIYNGVANGNLTFRETAGLVRGQARIHRMEHRAKADGFVGPLERARITAAQNRQSVRIFVKKHN